MYDFDGETSETFLKNINEDLNKKKEVLCLYLVSQSYKD